jgi:hypothetical protein
LATIPPDYVELTSEEMKNRGFTFKINKYDETALIELKFPERLLVKGSSLVPRYTYVVIKNKDGDVIASTTNPVENSLLRTVDTSYKHTLSDSSVSIGWGCPTSGASECHGAAITRISSVSKFFEANPDAANLPLKCRKVPNSKLEIWNCTE